MSYPTNYKQVVDAPHTYTEILSSNDIFDCDTAIHAFGEDTSLVIARPSTSCCSCAKFWFTVPEGFYAIVTRHGAQEDYVYSNGNNSCVWPPGVHFGAPWLKVSHLVTKQDMILKIPAKKCKTKDHVTIQFDTSIVFRVRGDASKGEDPRNIYSFVHYITARGLEDQMISAQLESTRILAQSVTHTEVLGLSNASSRVLSTVQSNLASPNNTIPMMPTELAIHQSRGTQLRSNTIHNEDEKELIGDNDDIDRIIGDIYTEAKTSIKDIMKARLNRQFMSQGIEIIDVIIQTITLPDEIQKQMAQSTHIISQHAVQRMQHKYDMLVLLQNEEVTTLEQAIDEKKREINKDGDLGCLKESLQLAYEHAVVDDMLKKINAQMKGDVALIIGENEATLQRINDGVKLEVEQVKGDAESDCAVALAEADQEVNNIIAKADAVSALNESKGNKDLYNAEGFSAPRNRKLNEHLTSLRQIKAQEALANNDKLVVTGTSGGLAANKLLLADAALKHVKSGEQYSSQRSYILSKLALASHNPNVNLTVGHC